MNLYVSLVRPHQEFAVQAWNPYLEKDNENRKGSNKSVKDILWFCNLSYEERLKRLNITSLKDRRVRGDLIEMYEVIRG